MHFAKDLLREKIRVRGTIKTITYKNKTKYDNYFTIFKFDCSEISGEIPVELSGERNNGGRFLTFTGYVPDVKQGVEYDIMAELVEHEKYGYQYNVIRMAPHIAVETREDLEKLFAYVLPEKTAQRLLDSLEDPVATLENDDVITLTRIPGIGVKTAVKIIDKYKESRIDMEAYIKLFKYGFTKHMIEKLVDHYGSPTTLIEKIETDPYILIYEVGGIGWNKADTIAQNGGMKPDDPRRIKAFIYYVCKQDSLVNGNTCMKIEDLLSYCYEQFPEIDETTIGMLVIDLAKSKVLHINKKEREVGLQENYKNEEFIAKELYRIANAPVRPIHNIEETIAACEKETGFTYSEEQKQAIRACLTQNVSILTALGGSGKTTSMMPVARAIRENGQTAELCALSGKASSNLGDITGLTGKTIHRMLGISHNGVQRDRDNPLSCDMVILDEASMIDEGIFGWLLEAIPDGCKLVMVGDTGQLEPIGAGCVFHDMINSQKFAHTHLTKIFRQAQKSGVITESRRVYDGEYIIPPSFYGTEIRGELQDFKIITTKTTDIVLLETLKEYKRMLADYNASPYDIVVVTGKRTIGDTSARKINECIQRIVNPNTYENEANVTKNDNGTEYHITFKPGDKVRVTRNNYDTENTEGHKTPIFNGNIGVIQEVDQGFMIVRFSQGDVIIKWYLYPDLELGYAITCHSAQGSGFPYVIAVCDNSSYSLLSKEWLYTALTRCKKFCTLVGQPTAIRRACSLTGIKYKQTWLKRIITNLWNSNGETVEENVE